MFSLIITIISIALVAALAVATIYYGGSAFTQGTAKANASALVAGAQQITGAISLYQNDLGSRPTLSTQLTPNYLASMPSPGGVTFEIGDGTTVAKTIVSAPVTSAATCVAIGTSAGSTMPTDGSALAAADDTKPYTCTGSGSPFDGTFTFKG